jgi:hypothetical protein
MWILYHTVKFCWGFGIQFAENVQANWQKGYCFIMTTRPHTARTTWERFQELQWELIERLAYSLDLAPSDFHLFSPLKKPPWWQTFRWWERGWNGGVQVAETTVKRLLCCGFRCTDKVMGQVYQCWWRMHQEINVFCRFEYQMFYILYPFVTCLLTPSCVFFTNHNRFPQSFQSRSQE